MPSIAKRYACLSDLLGYFKKTDLLSGLTNLEKKQVRYNIGVSEYLGEGGQTIPISITYDELYDLVIRKTLVVGARYIITDFQTIYSSNVKNGLNQKITWGKTINSSQLYNLVVIANTNETLDPRAMILSKPDWIVEYNVYRKTLEDGVKTKGKITYLKDDNNNSAPYDFKNIKFRRTRLQLEGTTLINIPEYLDLYTFSDIVNNEVIDTSELDTTKYNQIKEDCWNNIFIGDTYNNTFDSGCRDNTFLKGCHDNTFKWNTFNNLFNENVCYLTGSIYNKTIEIGDTVFSMTITKTIQKVNEVTLVSYLDPITYAYQIILL